MTNDYIRMIMSGDFYIRAKDDPNKSWQLRMAILTSSRQGDKSITEKDGGLYTLELLKNSDTDTFIRAHNQIEYNYWTPENKLRELGIERYNKLEELGLNAKNDRMWEIFNTTKFDHPGDKENFMNAFKEHRDLLDNVVSDIDDQMLKVRAEMMYPQAPISPVRSSVIDIKGWEKNDSNPRFAILIKGKGLHEAQYDIENMKETLKLKYNLTDDTIKVVETVEEVREAISSMKQYGIDNKEAAGLIYYSGHGVLDNKNLTYGTNEFPKGVEETRGEEFNHLAPQGQFRTTLNLCDEQNNDKYLHEYELKDLVNEHLKSFDGKLIMIIDSCYAGSLVTDTAHRGENLDLHV